MLLLDNCACSRIEVYSQSGKKYHPYLYGTYLRRADKVNGRPFYISDAYGGKYGIWWVQDITPNQWQIGYSKVFFFHQCSKMQIIPIKKFNIQTSFFPFLWFFKLNC